MWGIGVYPDRLLGNRYNGMMLVPDKTRHVHHAIAKPCTLSMVYLKVRIISAAWMQGSFPRQVARSHSLHCFVGFACVGGSLGHIELVGLVL